MSIFKKQIQFEDREHESLMGFWWSGVLLKKNAAKFFARHGITDAQFNIMFFLKYTDESLNQQQLSERLLVDKSNITGVCGRMEKNGLLIRSDVPGDRRAYAIKLTRKGLQLLNTIEPDYRKMIHSVMDNFSPAELADSNRLNEKLQRSINDYEG